MNNKNLYDEGDINEEEELENEGESEIIDNNDGCFDDFDDTNQADINQPKESDVPIEEIPKEAATSNLQSYDSPKEQSLPITKEKSPNAESEVTPAQYTKEDLLSMLMNQNNYEEEEEVVIHNKTNAKPSMHSNIESGGVEKDFDVALTKILSKMVKESDDNTNNNNEIYDILLCDKEKVEEELNKYEFCKKVNIDEKINNYLDKKNKNLQNLEDKLNEDFKKQCTFVPETNTNAQTKQRNLSQFLKDQEEYQRKINDKRLNLKDAQEQEELNALKQKPKICNTSAKIAQNKNKGEEVHSRLYNKRAQTTITTAPNKSPPKKPLRPNANINKSNDEKFDHLYQEAKNREKKIKEKENQQTRELKEAKEYKSNMSSNKYLFKRFKQLYKEEVEKLLSKNNMEQPQLTFEFMKELLTNLRFFPLTKINELEGQLLNEIFDNLHNEEELMSIEHIFIFCLSILNLLEYYLLSSYQCDPSAQKVLKSSQSGKTLKSSNSQLSNIQDENMPELKRMLDNDLNKRIVNAKKYGGYDNENNFIISLSHSKLIFKDFSILYQNYSQSNANKSKKTTAEQLPPFKPSINQKSQELCNKYKQKVIKETSNSRQISNGNILLSNMMETSMNNNTNNNMSNINVNNTNFLNNQTINVSSNKPLSSKERFDLLYLESAKKKNFFDYNEKLRKEKEIKELESCTFKPKINTNYQMKNNVYPMDQSQTIEQRSELLYKKGTEILIHKKDKSKGDIEMELHGKDCTFKPIVHDVNYDIFDSKLSVCHDDDLAKFNERLKNGRFEREFKGSFLERGEFSVLPRNKSESRVMFRPKSQCAQTVTKKERKMPQTETKLRPKAKTRENIDETPLLQIDVNLKNGIKKNVFVYEGDTAESLALNFAIENQLDDNMKKKLQVLIQAQIDKLLMKIAEESGTSYKSNA